MEQTQKKIETVGELTRWLMEQDPTLEVTLSGDYDGEGQLNIGDFLCPPVWLPGDTMVPRYDRQT